MDRFDEITNVKALQEECRNLYAQLKFHQKQEKKLRQDLYLLGIMYEASVAVPVEVPESVCNQEQFQTWLQEEIR